MTPRIFQFVLIALVGWCPLACQVRAAVAHTVDECRAADDRAVPQPCSCCQPPSERQRGDENRDRPADCPDDGTCQCFCSSTVVVESVIEHEVDNQPSLDVTVSPRVVETVAFWQSCEECIGIPLSITSNAGRAVRHLCCSLIC